MKAKLFSLAAAATMLLAASASADTFGPGAGGALVDAASSNSIPGSGVFTSTINVLSAGNIVSFDSVTLTGLSHTFVGDLQVYLESPNGTRVNLFSRLGVTTATGSGNGNDLSGNYTFTAAGAAFGGAGGLGAVPAGTYARSTNTTAATVQVGATGVAQGINNNTYANYTGQSITGIWTLTIRDFFPADTGSLGSWSFNATVPGPGGLALLGLAGLVGRRRRSA